MIVLAAEIAVVGGEALSRFPSDPLDRRGLDRFARADTSIATISSSAANTSATSRSIVRAHTSLPVEGVDEVNARRIRPPARLALPRTT
jgi:hypothetical protein